MISNIQKRMGKTEQQMINNKELTIYVCTYHEEKNIQDCINSISRNGFKNIFIIDASTDNLTSEKVKEVGFKVIRTSKGLAGQRQKAIEHCETEYLMFVDADDRLELNCINVLFKELTFNNYDCIQAKVRINNPLSYWQKGMDANNKYCTCLPGPTKMIGRPALYKTKFLKQVEMDVGFNNIGNEDAALSIRMEMIGERQGIGNGISFRFHPYSFKENFMAWRKYGYGDANLIKKYNKIHNVLKHQLFIYPIKRSLILIANKKGKYIGYTILSGLIRFFFMISSFVLKNHK